jgi:hypothetical protein
MKKARPQRFFMSNTSTSAELLREVEHLGHCLFCGSRRPFPNAGGAAATALPGLHIASDQQLPATV